MKEGDKALVDPKLTGLDSWILGEVIDVESTLFEVLSLLSKINLVVYFFGEEKYFKLA